MSDVFHDRVRETCTGTNGSFTLLGAVAQHQSFSAVGNGNTCRYTVVDADGIKWGTFGGVWQTGGTLTRVTTYESSNGVGQAVTLSAGTHQVFLTPDSTSIAFQQNQNTFTATQRFESNAIGVYAGSESISTGFTYSSTVKNEAGAAVVGGVFTGTAPGVGTQNISQVVGVNGIAVSSLPVSKVADEVVAGIFSAENTGAGTVGEVLAVRASVYCAGAGDISYAEALSARVENAGSATIGEVVGVWIASAANTGGGAITAVTGLQIANQSAGATNYAIKTGTGLVDLGDNVKVAKYIEGAEMTAPSAPAANGYRIFAEDNGAGKTRLMVQFATGAAQQIAIEP